MLLHPWDFPGKSTGVGCHFLLQEIFPTQGLNPGLPHCRQTLYRLSHQGSQQKKITINKIKAEYTRVATNLKNIQATPAAQFQKNKQPNQKVGQRTKQTFLQRRHIDG